MINIRGCDLNAAFLASRIDYDAALDHTMDQQTLDTHLRIAMDRHVHSICVNPHYLEYTLDKLKETTVMTAVTLDFPWGGGSRAIKAMMAEDYASRGAQAIEHTMDIAAIKNGNWALIQQELSDLVKAAQGAETRTIIECCLLSSEELSPAVQCCQEAASTAPRLAPENRKGRNGAI